MDVINDAPYKHVKSQCEIIYIMGYTKMTIFLFWRFQNAYTHIHTFYPLCVA